MTQSRVLLEVDIADGCSRDRLIDAFKYSFDETVVLLVEFMSDDGITYNIQIDDLRHKDRTGHSFHFAGRLFSRTKRTKFLRSTELGTFPYVHGFITTGVKRRGHMVITDSYVGI